MNTQTIETRARRILQDTMEPYRWPSTEIKDDLVDALSHLASIRPETRYIGGMLNDAIEIDEDGDFQVDAKFLEGLVYYVVYKCYLNDSSDTVNQQLAESYLAKANTYMQL